jgi:hypothetical protein
MPLSGEGRGVIAGELPDVGRRPSGDLGDRQGNRCRFAAPVVRIILEEALDLPGQQDPAQARGEGLRRYVGKADVAADSGGQGRGDLRMSCLATTHTPNGSLTLPNAR